MNISLIYIIEFPLAQLSVMVSSLGPSAVLVIYRYIILYACMLVTGIDYYIMSLYAISSPPLFPGQSPSAPEEGELQFPSDGAAYQ